MENNHLLLVDDDPFILEGIGSDLEINGYRVTRAASGELAVDLLEKEKFDLIITDLIMETMDGIQVLKRAKELDPEVQVIILTGYGDLSSAIKAMRNQADDYLLKPCESQEMIFRVKNCLEKQDMLRKINLYRQILPMCCGCQKIRDDSGKEPGSGEWVEVDTYIHKRTGQTGSATYCPQCARGTAAE